MNRRKLFAAMAGMLGAGAGAGVAKAQQWKECIPRKGVWQQPEGLSDKFCSEQFEPALNNQCPVCGTMAEPYRVKERGETCEEWRARGIDHMLDDPGGCDYPGMNLTRCKRCSAAFWQDAEVTKVEP